MQINMNVEGEQVSHTVYKLQFNRLCMQMYNKCNILQCTMHIIQYILIL